MATQLVTYVPVAVHACCGGAALEDDVGAQGETTFGQSIFCEYVGNIWPVFACIGIGFCKQIGGVQANS